MDLLIARLALNLLKAGKLEKLKKLAMQFNAKTSDDARKFIRKAEKTIAGTPNSKVRPVVHNV